MTGEDKELKEVNTDFMKEKIKARPVNKRKLLRRTITTACLAALFGAVACVAFLVLEPVINRAINPEEPQQVSIPEETSEEISPEDMIASDEARQKQETEEAVSQAVSQIGIDTNSIKQEIKEELSKEMKSTSGYKEMYDGLAEAAVKAQESIVSVKSITPDYDWAGDAYDQTGSSSGLIAAATSEDVLILAPGDILKSARRIEVTFPDDAVAEAVVRAIDSVTGMAVITVDRKDLSEETQGSFGTAVFGSSQRINLLGRPVIAVGSPTGSLGSVAYGVVTNAQLPLDMTDSSYVQLTTDIYGSTRASGVLVDTNSEVIGWIDDSHNAKDTPNLLSAIGITELKPLIERMSNGEGLAGAGFHGTAVPEEVQKEQGVPAGAYITRVEIDSPAMEAGLQSGDIVTGFGLTQIGDYQQLITALSNAQPGRDVPLTIMRQGADHYEEAELTLTPENRLQAADNS